MQVFPDCRHPLKKEPTVGFRHCEELEATKQSLFLQEIASLLTVARDDTVA